MGKVPELVMGCMIETTHYKMQRSQRKSIILQKRIILMGTGDQSDIDIKVRIRSSYTIILATTM